MVISTRKTYSEVYSILNMLGEEYINKIPKKLFYMILEEKEEGYEPTYSEDISLGEQPISREAISMLALLHLNYWCESKEEKESLAKQFRQNEEQYQKEIQEKYSINNIIKPREPEIENTQTENAQTALVEYKENVWKKFANRIRSIFTRRKFY